jgi:hypothetical protein
MTRAMFASIRRYHEAPPGFCPAEIRERVCERAAWFGIALDRAANRAGGARTPQRAAGSRSTPSRPTRS